MFAAKLYPWYDLLWSWTCNWLNMLNIGHIWPLTLTLTSGVKSQVGIAFAAKGYPWCGIFDPHPSNLLPSLKVDRFGHHPWPWPLRSNPRSSSCLQRQTTLGSTTFILYSANHKYHSILICPPTLTFGVKLKVAHLVQPLSCEEPARRKLCKNIENWRSSEGTDGRTDRHTQE